METKVNYALVGAFVLLFSTAFILGVIWLSSGAQYRKSYDTYLCYLDESVSGLNLNAPVRYRGVDVGRVKEISLDQEIDGGKVRLAFEIESGTMIREDTIAVLRSQGLTGIAFIDLTGGSRESPLLKPKKGAKYAVIKSGPSLMTRIDSELSSLIAHLDRTLESVSDVLSEKSRRDIASILANLAVVSRTLAAKSGSIDQGLANGAKILHDGARVSESLPGLVGRMQASIDSIDRTAKDAELTSKAARNTLENADKALPELQAAIAEARELAASLRRASEQIEQNPSVLIYGRPGRRAGPGE